MRSTRKNTPAIEATRGDITTQSDIEVIVNAANAWLRRGGGVCGAIHRAAGPGLEEECLSLATPIKPGQAVITGAHNLPNKYVIHCLGPVYGKDKPEDKLLADCYRNALMLADKHKVESIAFPAISTGIFGYPVDLAATVTVSSIRKTLPLLKNINRVRLVLFSDDDFHCFKQQITNQ